MQQLLYFVKFTFSIFPCYRLLFELLMMVVEKESNQ